MDTSDEGLAQPSADTRRRIRFILLIHGAALLLALTLLACHVRSERRSVLDHAADRTDLTADLVAVRSGKAVSDLEQLLNGIVTSVVLLNPAGRHDPAVRALLLEIQQFNPHVLDLLMLDARGEIAHWSGSGALPRMRERDYVAAQLGQPLNGLFFGEPEMSRANTGQWFVGVSQAVRGAGRERRQIIVAIVDIAYFRRQLDTIQLPRHGALMLQSSQGKVIARIPEHEKFIGRPVDAAPRLNGKKSGRLESVFPFDDLPAVATYRRLDNANLRAFASVATDAVLADWYRNAWRALLLGLMLVLYFFATTWRAVRAQRQIALQRNRLDQLAVTDELTGLYSRDHFMRAVESEMAAARRHAYPLSYLLVDIDHFRTINELFGHQGGDQALVALADAIRHILRAEDVPCRLGADEFALLLPHTELSGAHIVAERLREQVAAIALEQSGDIVGFTVRIGLAQWDGVEDVPAPFLLRADAALDAAKRQGGDRVCS